MSKTFDNLIGYSPDFVKDKLQEEGYDVKFGYTRGFKDKEILTEEYVVRIDCSDRSCNVIISCFNTMI